MRSVLRMQQACKRKVWTQISIALMAALWMVNAQAELLIKVTEGRVDAVPIAVVSLAVPLLFRRFLIGRLEQVRGQFGMFGGQGETIDGSWHDAEPARRDPPRDEPAGVIIDQRPRGDGDD